MRNKGPVLLGQVLQFVEVEIAAEAHGRQHDDLPVVHALATALATAVTIDIVADQFQELLSQRRVAVDVLQSAQDRNDLIATLEVKFNVQNGSRVQAGLGIDRKAHAVSPLKIAHRPLKSCGIPHGHDRLALDLHEEVPKNAQQIGFFAFSDRL